MLRFLGSTLFTIPIAIQLNDEVISIRRYSAKGVGDGVPGENLEIALKKERYFYVIISRFRDPCSLKKGDYVSFTHPYDPQTNIIRKVTYLENSYILMNAEGQDSVIHVPRGHCWVDSHSCKTKHRNYDEMSSETFGPLSVGLIEGKPLLVLSLDSVSLFP